jgi:hypothetical protein
VSTKAKLGRVVVVVGRHAIANSKIKVPKGGSPVVILRDLPHLVIPENMSFEFPSPFRQDQLININTFYSTQTSVFDARG